jgi:hypothetical protein
MQVLVRKSEKHQDVHCTICGQGFRLYWERSSLAEQATMRSVILAELREQHAPQNGNNQTPSAHPEVPFNLPSWTGSPQFSGAALLGGLSGVRRVVPRVNRDETK